MGRLATASLALALCIFGVRAEEKEKPVMSKLGFQAVGVDSKDEHEARDTVITKDGKEYVRISGGEPVSFSPDGKILLLREMIPDDDCRHFLVDVASGERAKPNEPLKRVGSRYVEKVEWSKDGKSLTFTHQAESDVTPVAGSINKLPAKEK